VVDNVAIVNGPIFVDGRVKVRFLVREREAEFFKDVECVLVASYCAGADFKAELHTYHLLGEAVAAKCVRSVVFKAIEGLAARNVFKLCAVVGLVAWHYWDVRGLRESRGSIEEDLLCDKPTDGRVDERAAKAKGENLARLDDFIWIEVRVLTVEAVGVVARLDGRS